MSLALLQLIRQILNHPISHAWILRGTHQTTLPCPIERQAIKRILEAWKCVRVYSPYDFSKLKIMLPWVPKIGIQFVYDKSRNSTVIETYRQKVHLLATDFKGRCDRNLFLNPARFNGVLREKDENI